LSSVDWKTGEPPKGRRILIIGTPKGIPVAGLEPDLVVGFWHEQNEEYMLIEIPADADARARSGLNVLFWAELPEMPSGLSLRSLSIGDTHG
jgi:hypothetical protein